MIDRLHKPLLTVTFAVALAIVSLLALAGTPVKAGPAAAPAATLGHQQTTGTATVTDTTAVADPGEHLLHHPEEAAATISDTVSLPSMMGMMGEMMSMMGQMQGMMGQGMMGAGPVAGSMPMTGTMPIAGSQVVSDCMMVGPMMSMMGSMMSMMGAMQTIEGMMAGHGAAGGMGLGGAAMLEPAMMAGSMMTATTPVTGTMPMAGPMMGQGMMGMMGSAEMGFMLDHMMLMMGQMQAMVTQCQQTGQGGSAQAFELRFIDGMIPHHEGAIAMAQQALEQAEHEELRQMAQEIITAQEAEIAQLQAWRSAWYPDAGPTAGMGMDMGTMEIAEGEAPFDLRFIDAMIPHHEGAIMMARAALASGEHDELKQMAQDIIDAQQAEIAQLQEWRATWYPDAP